MNTFLHILLRLEQVTECYGCIEKRLTESNSVNIGYYAIPIERRPVGSGFQKAQAQVQERV
jgi:hypothetical protein